MRRIDVLGSLLLAAGLCAACQDPLNRQRVYQPAILRRLVTDSINFTAPDTVGFGANVIMTVTTYGGACDLFAETNAGTVAADSAHFIPINVTETSDGACPDEDLGLIRTIPHADTIQFTHAGPATVTIFGRDATGLEMIRTRKVFVRAP